MTGDPWRLDGRAAIVTGAGRGLGRGCALELARSGATTMIVARTESELEATAAEIGPGAAPHVADVTDEAQVGALIARAAALGDLGVLVCAAGTNRPGPARDYPMADWDVLFDVNVRATFMVCRAFAEQLLARGARGSIVTVSSQMGSVGSSGPRGLLCPPSMRTG